MLLGAPFRQAYRKAAAREQRCATMTALIDELGPVGGLIVELPGQQTRRRQRSRSVQAPLASFEANAAAMKL